MRRNAEIRDLNLVLVRSVRGDDDEQEQFKPREWGLIRRLFGIIPILLITWTIVFGAMHMVPGDPVQLLLGGSPADAHGVQPGQAGRWVHPRRSPPAAMPAARAARRARHACGWASARAAPGAGHLRARRA